MVILLLIVEFAGAVACFFSENWSIISHIMMEIVTSLGLYAGAMMVVNTIQTIHNIIIAITVVDEAM